MKAVITADWHFGYPDRLDDISWAFRGVLRHCTKNGIGHVWLLGDLIHDRESVTHDVTNRLAELFEEANAAGIEILIFPGNHDMYLRYSWKINAIKPFAKYLNLVESVSSFDFGGRKFWIVPFIEHEKTYQRVVSLVSDQASDRDVLLTHIGVNSAVYNQCFLIQNWNIVSFEETKFSRVYTGHFHCTQKVGSKTWYPGSPISFRFDEGLVEHGFLVYDSDTNDHEFIDIYAAGTTEAAPPDFITMESDFEQSDISGNNIRILLKEGEDEVALRAALMALGARKVAFTRPTEQKIVIKDSGQATDDNIFESWLVHDNPAHLEHALLVSLERESRADTVMSEEEDDD